MVNHPMIMMIIIIINNNHNHNHNNDNKVQWMKLCAKPVSLFRSASKKATIFISNLLPTIPLFFYMWVNAPETILMNNTGLLRTGQQTRKLLAIKF